MVYSELMYKDRGLLFIKEFQYIIEVNKNFHITVIFKIASILK